MNAYDESKLANPETHYTIAELGEEAMLLHAMGFDFSATILAGSRLCKMCWVACEVYGINEVLSITSMRDRLEALQMCGAIDSDQVFRIRRAHKLFKRVCFNDRRITPELCRVVIETAREAEEWFSAYQPEGGDHEN